MVEAYGNPRIMENHSINTEREPFGGIAIIAVFLSQPPSFALGALP